MLLICTGVDFLANIQWPSQKFSWGQIWEQTTDSGLFSKSIFPACSSSPSRKREIISLILVPLGQPFLQRGFLHCRQRRASLMMLVLMCYGKSYSVDGLACMMPAWAPPAKLWLWMGQETNLEGARSGPVGSLAGTARSRRADQCSGGTRINAAISRKSRRITRSGPKLRHASVMRQ